MPFTFAYRSPYNNLTGRYIRRFEDDTILSWFQKHWNSGSSSEKILGQATYGFESLFDHVSEKQIPIPQTVEELGEVLKVNIYAEEGVRFAPQMLEVFTDDDELDLQYFMIEDEFAKQNPDRTSFLLHEGSLPTEAPVSESKPCTWLYVHSPVQSADSQTWDRVKCEGVRLADGPRAVIEAYQGLRYAEAEKFYSSLVEWKDSEKTWQEIIEAWVEQCLQSNADDAKLEDGTQLICDQHIIQLHHHAETWKRAKGLSRLFYQVIVFDDVWAAEHPHLAKSIDFYASDRSLLAKDL